MPNFFAPLRRAARAFTLVELMVVIAIIGVLSAVALPAYNNYSTKAKFTEVVLAAAPTKTAISTCAVSGDCVSGTSIVLNASGSNTLLVPTAATVPATSPVAYDVFYAALQAQNAVSGKGWTATQIAGFAQADVNANNFLMPDPSNPANLCIALLNATNCYPGGAINVPISAFNQYYAPNAAILNGSKQTMPCVGGSGCAPATKYAASVSYDSAGVITATAQTTSGLKSETFVLAPALSAGRVEWTASGSCKTRAGGALC